MSAAPQAYTLPWKLSHGVSKHLKRYAIVHLASEASIAHPRAQETMIIMTKWHEKSLSSTGSAMIQIIDNC